MTVQRFGRADRRNARAENVLDRRRFGRIVRARAGAVRVDVPDVVRVHARIRERQAHRARGAVGGGIGDVARVAGRAESGDLAEDLRAAALCVLERLEHEHRRALGEHEAFAIRAERTARLLGMLVVDREHAQRFPRLR